MHGLHLSNHLLCCASEGNIMTTPVAGEGEGDLWVGETVGDCGGSGGRRWDCEDLFEGYVSFG